LPTWPPCFAHWRALEVITHPFPLHEFWPMHPCAALLQELCPLHELPPTHLTCAGAPLEAGVLEAAKALPVNMTATAVASIAPLKVDFLMNDFSFRFDRARRYRGGRSAARDPRSTRIAFYARKPDCAINYGAAAARDIFARRCYGPIT
jgi:hypothetical protein